VKALLLAIIKVGTMRREEAKRESEITIKPLKIGRVSSRTSRWLRAPKIHHQETGASKDF